MLVVKWASYEDKCEHEGIEPGVGVQQISPPVASNTTFSGYKPQGEAPAQYYPRPDGVVKLTVGWEFAVVLLSTLCGFLTILYENNRYAPCLFTQLNLQEDSPVHVSQYKFYGTQQPTPNAVKQAFEKQQKESYDLGAGSALLARSAQDWLPYKLNTGDWNFEPSGTPGGIVEVFHRGQRNVPIPTNTRTGIVQRGSY